MNNLNLIGSFIIGGLLLISILTLSTHLTSKSQSTIMSEIAQSNITEFGRVVEYDFNKIGYGVGAKIISADSSSIRFLADLNNDLNNGGTIDSVNYSTIANGSLIKIVRRTSLDQSNAFRFEAADFNIQGFDSNGNPTTNPSQIKSIRVSIVLDKEFRMLDETDQIGAFWSRRFFPKNL